MNTLTVPKAHPSGANIFSVSMATLIRELTRRTYLSFHAQMLDQRPLLHFRIRHMALAFVVMLVGALHRTVPYEHMIIEKSRGVLQFTSKASKGFSAWWKLLASVTFFGAITIFGLICCDFERTEEQHASISENNQGRQAPHFSHEAVYDVMIQPRDIENFEVTQVKSNYCQIDKCKVVTCAFIPAQLQPEKVASSFITTEFKTECPNVELITLTFQNCKFSDNTLRKNWLDIDLLVEELVLHKCELDDIADDAFFSRIFRKTKVLSLSYNYISILRRATFSYLPMLEQLRIQDNHVFEAEKNLLADVASTLEVLQLDRSLWNPNVLLNVTGENPLPNVQILSLQRNALPIVEGSFFKGLRNVRVLYMDKSQVSKLKSDSFVQMAPYLATLTLTDNYIESLSKELFSPILEHRESFTLSLEGNPWNCDCSLKWMQDFINKNVTHMTKIPKCDAPSENICKSFVDAEFCNGQQQISTSTTLVTVSESITEGQSSKTYTSRSTLVSSTTEDSTFNPMVCEDDNGIYFNQGNSRKVLDTVDYKLPLPTVNFSLMELENGTILVTLLNSGVPATLLWYEKNSRSMVDNAVRRIRCMRNAKGSYLLRDTLPETTYTVCCVDPQRDVISPLDCSAIITRPQYPARAWLLNRQKTIVLTTSSILIISICLISCLFAYAIIRRHPTLLRGSKRLLPVKHRNLDALLLPKGVRVHEIDRKPEPVDIVNASKFFKQHDYVTPLPSRRPPSRKDSRTSEISFQSSAGTYVSGIEPPIGQFTLWRQIGRKSIVLPDIDPPPLPPHRPRRIIPSVSRHVELFTNQNDFSLTI